VRAWVAGTLLALALIVAAQLVLSTERPLVVFWTTLSACGIAVSAYLVNETRLDLIALRDSRNGRRSLAWSRLFRESVRVTVHGMYFLAGLIALRIIPLPTVLILVAIIYGNVALVANSMIDARARRVLNAYREQYPNVH